MTTIYRYAIIKWVIYMHFNEIFNKMITDRGVCAMDICNGANVKKAWLSKLRSGKLFPSDWGDIRRIACFLNLSDTEYSSLCEAYKSECLPADIYTIDHAVHRMYRYEFHEPMLRRISENYQAPAGGSLMQNDALWDTACDILRSAQHIRLDGVPDHPDLQDPLYDLLLSAAPEHSQFDWLMHLERAEQSFRNVCVLADAFPLLIRARANVKEYYAPIPDNLPFPIMLAGDSRLILYSQNGASGIYLTDAAAAAYISHFDRAFSEAASDLIVFRDMLHCLSALNEMMPKPEEAGTGELHLLLKNPWTVNDATRGDIRSHMSKEGAAADFITQNYFQFLSNSIDSQGVIYNYFTEQGLQEIMNADEYCEFNSSIVQNISKELRHKLFYNMVENAGETDQIYPALLFEQFPNSGLIRGLNLWDSGKMIIGCDCGGQFVILMSQEQSIVRTLIVWLKALRRCGIISSKEHTISVCKQALQTCNE